MIRKRAFQNDLYVISSSVVELKQAVDDGAAIVQLRDKTSDTAAVAEKARELVEYRAQKPFIFILNDDPALAVKVGADGVHIGQDMSTADARAIVGEDLIVGKTTHSLEQGRQAIEDGADYISTGPVYPTPTKPGRPAVGLEYVRDAARHLDIPAVAIGGIDLTNIDSVLAAGARTIGVVRASGDAVELLRRIKKASR